MLSMILVLFLIALNGCCITTGFYLKNNSGEDIDIRSHHTGKITHIKSGQERKILHTKGQISINTLKGHLWEYPSLSILNIKDQKYRLFHKKFCGSTITIFLSVNDAGEICILPIKNRNVDTCPLEQPNGFPLKSNVPGATGNP